MGKATPRTWKTMADWYGPGKRLVKLVPSSVQQSEVRLMMGDDPRWAAPDWDDSTWKVISRKEVPLNAGVFWLRVRVRTTGRDEPIPRRVIIGGPSAWVCYWDGVATFIRGTPGTSLETEVDAVSEDMNLPPALATPGEHVIALRASTFRNSRVGGPFAAIFIHTVPPEKRDALHATMNMFPAMGVGAMLTFGMGVFVMWVLADRRLILALFSALCLSSALLIAVAAAPYMWKYPPSWSYAQSVGRVGMVVVVASLLLTVTMLHLWPSTRRRWLLLPVILESMIAWWYLPLGVNTLTPLLWRVAFALGMILAAGGIWRRRQGSWPVLAGLAITAGLHYREPKRFEHSDFLGAFLPFLIGLIAAIALQLRTERLQARDTKLMAARLEIELLKKSLQPHFLMNTLTALSQVVEEKPAAAVRLIEDLATEFRSLSRFSGEKQVSIVDELALCRAHLGVMSARTDLAWKLEAEGIDVKASVPPALFLTLIENGFSHQRAQKDATAFTLRAERTGHNLRYTFVSPGAVTSEPTRASGGTGLRYVRARLEESFQGAWTLSQRAVPGGWETVIELRQIASSRVAT